jgi:hypothetical protein
VDLPNDPWYTTTCRHISADCITHGDKTWSIHLPWGLSPAISSVLLNVPHGTHGKQHVGILLCLLASTWIHSKSSFLNELHGPVWMWWSSNLSQHLPPLLAGIKLMWRKHGWLSTKYSMRFNVWGKSHTYLISKTRDYEICKWLVWVNEIISIKEKNADLPL